MTARVHVSNTLWLTLSGALAKALLFAASVITYKNLSLPANGLLGFGLAYATIAALFMEMGVRGYTIRELSRVRENAAAALELYGLVWSSRVALVLLVTPLGLGAALLMGYTGAKLGFLAALLLFGLLDSIATMQKGMLRCYGLMQYDAICSLLSKGLLVTMLLMAVGIGRFTLTMVAMTFVLSAFLEVLVLWYATRLKTTLRWSRQPAKGEIIALLKRSLPFASMILLMVIYVRTAVFALSAQSWLVAAVSKVPFLPRAAQALPSEVSVAQFTTAARLPEALGFLPTAVMNALIPFLARSKGNPQAVQSLFTTLVKYLGLIGFLIAPWFATQASGFLLIIAKAEYLAAVPAFIWLAVAVPFSFLHYTTANLLICLDAERAVIRREIYALALNLILNLILVPYFGFTGAAAALAICEVFSVALDLRILRTHQVRLPFTLWIYWLLPSLVVALVGWACRGLPPLADVACAGIAAGILFAGLLWRDPAAKELLLRRGSSGGLPANN